MAIADDLRHDASDLALDALDAAADLVEDSWAITADLARDAKDTAVDLGESAVELIGDLSSTKKASFPWRMVAIVATAIGLGALVFWMLRRRTDQSGSLLDDPVAESDSVASAMESTDLRRATG